MSHQILLVFLLLFFVCCQLCGQRCVAGSLSEQTNIDLNSVGDFLKLDEKEVKYEFDSTGTNKKNTPITEVKNIGPVFLVANNNFLVALAEVSNDVSGSEKINILAKFFKTEGKNLSQDTLKSREWKTQLATKNPTDLKNKFKIKSFAVVVNSNKIYYFLVTGSNANSQLHVAVFVGEKNTGSPQNEAMKWRTLESEKLTNFENLNENLKITPDKIPPVVRFGFSNGEKIVFAIQGENKKDSDGKNKYVTVFFQLDGEKEELEEYHVQPTGNCYFSLFLWKEEIVMTPTVCEPGDESNQKMKVFDYKQKQFNESDRPIFRLQEFLKDKKNFVTTKIDTETEVLLFTQHDKEHKIYLWMTDGSRTAKVDTIITGGESKENFDLSMLHINDELFVLYNNYGAAVSNGVTEGKSTYTLKHLPDQLKKIKKTLDAWKNTDNEIKKFFKKTDTAETLVFKYRLVGFLSDNGEDNRYWKDEYFYENATVTSGRKTSEGFTFSGEKAGAKWLVKEENKDQPYNFAAFGFTLVATVKIDKDTNDKWNSILGVGLGGSEKKSSFGLWCNKGVWGFGGGKNPEEATSTTETCVRDEKYRVVLTMGSNEISLYIDGKKMKGLPKNSIGVQQQPLSVTHFYFGVNDAEQGTQPTNIEGHVTVTNVLLYNRPFDVGEVNNLKECPKTSKINENPKEEHGTTEQKNDQPLTPRPTDSDEKKEDKKAPSPSRTEDGGVGGGVCVFSLLLAVLCVSAPLLHL